MRARCHPHRVRRAIVCAIALGVVAAACADRSDKTLEDPVFPLPATTLASTSLPEATTAATPLTLLAPWVDGTEIPARHTCSGDGVSPALTWSNVPPDAVELAITVADLDDAQYVHWIVYAISAAETGMIEGQLPAGALEWPGSSGAAGWQPPCPPAGETHRYQFTVHALNQQLEAADDASAAEVLSILNATSIDLSSVSGLSTGDG